MTIHLKREEYRWFNDISDKHIHKLHKEAEAGLEILYTNNPTIYTKDVIILDDSTNWAVKNVKPSLNNKWAWELIVEKATGD